MAKKRLRTFQITIEYSDIAYFRKEIRIHARDEDHAMSIYDMGFEDFVIISDKMFARGHDPHEVEMVEIVELDVITEQAY